MGKKWLVFFFIIVLFGVFIKKNKNDIPILKICVWSNYFPEEALSTFTAKTGIKVEVSLISSNEELLAKLKAGARDFDIIQPSDYMVRQLKRLDMLHELDDNLLPNKKIIDDFFVHLPYDPGLHYSVPFTWGTTGIAVNSSVIDLKNMDISWKLLFNSPVPKYTSMLDDVREVFTAALLMDGKDANSKDIDSLEIASKRIKDAKILMFTSEPKAFLLRGEIHIAHVYSVDAIQAAKENPNIKYFIPKEGAVIWTDNLAILKSSRKIAEAHKFINYFLASENALELFSKNYLATPSSIIRNKLPENLRNDEYIYPSRVTMKKLFFLEDFGENMNILSRMWTELKS